MIISSKKNIFRIFAVITGILGVFIVTSTLYPIFSYEWESEVKYPDIISPLENEKEESFKVISKDYTKVEEWIIDETIGVEASGLHESYYLSIPKLKIKNAAVVVGGDDLSKSLIQYTGTAMPGETGNSVIFGHSVLPAFYNPENYLSIFSLLPELEVSDEIFINYQGKIMRFVVEDVFEVRPKDIQILEQSKKASFVTLVTCAPPGHPLKPKRLIVRARLIPSL